MKRPLEKASAPSPKKAKVSPDKKQKTKDVQPPPQRTSLLTEEVDFPRGGGTTLTPLEVKALRAEAVKEANEELLKDGKVSGSQTKPRKRKSELKAKHKSEEGNGGTIRPEHLNYKRITPGMKLYGQIFSVQPLALVVSLPNQLWAHVPITQISSQLTSRLEKLDEDEEMPEASDEDEDSPTSGGRVPDLYELFRAGQYVRGIVTAVHPSGSTDSTLMGRAKDEAQKASRRIEMSLLPQKVNEGLAKADMKTGLTISAAVASLEDHGYILELGVPNVTGFLSYREAEKGPFPKDARLHVGQILDVAVSAMSGNGRTCTVSVDPKSLANASISEISNVSSVIPGMLVHSLVTAVLPGGLNLQVLGSFEATVDEYHVRAEVVEQGYRIGQKVKGRILYDVPGTAPPRFALSLLDHIVKRDVKRAEREDTTQQALSLPEAYPVGQILDNVEVVRVESERGLIVAVQPGLTGFIHISQTSDEHVPTLSANSGPWKVGTLHRARVTGYLPFDGLLQLSMRPSILDQKFLQVSDVEVGSIIKGTIKKLTDSAMFVSISGSVDGVIWPNHYADIALKHPQKRFKPGSSIRCRVLVVDPERQRVVLTAKKTLIESTLPVVARLNDAKPGVVTHAVVFKVSEKNLNVEFYNGLKAIIPSREISETASGRLAEAFPIGKPVTVRIISVNPEAHRIVASIRQAAPNYKSAIVDISGVEIGNIVHGTVAEIHKDNVVVTLQPTQVRALLSLGNLANRRGLTVAQLRVSLQPGDELDDLVVVSRNAEKGFVVVASRPKGKDALVTKGAISLETLEVGQVVGGRVLRHGPKGAYIKLTNQIHGSLHPTDACDDYEFGTPFPSPDSVLKAAVLAIDKEKKHLTLSTRQSRLNPDSHPPIVDPEIQDHAQIKVGDTLRGFIKSVTEHGLFVTIGRGIDARVQIKELFDEYIKDWKPRFVANQLVKGRILSVNIEKKQVEMSFRSGTMSKVSPSISFADLHEGQKVDGRVKKVEDYGLFIGIEGSKLTGLCHKSELSDNKDADVTLALRSFREGDRVKAVILSLDSEKHRISLGLKPSYFKDEEFVVPDEDDQLSTASTEFQATLGVVEDEPILHDIQGNGGYSEREEEMSADQESEEEMVMDVDDRSHTGGDIIPDQGDDNGIDAEQSLPPLKLQGFKWGDDRESLDSDAESASSSDDSDGEEQGKKKRKRRRKKVEQDLTADLQTKTPESSADFERLLLGSPNSSYIWIQYMSFQLRLAEIEKARDIGRRALRTINFREEAEKLNIWMALLNLENVYGTDESLENTFKEAARSSDSKTVHLRLAAIFDESGKHDRAEEQFKRTTKKFGHSSKVWTLFCEHYLRHGRLEEARSLLPRSLQSLEKRKHLKTISKFAQLEYKLGDPERGRTIFEGIIDSHPKRHDLWLVYIDMEAVQGEIQNIRNLFGRIFTQKMTSRKAKTLFKKWLELERRIGDEDGQATVKQKAIEWTQRASGSD
ncbi:hypothetical protein GLOTRDRAFT_124234 [Gloeophyllum trabeum ATCC 11539]|uniref:S1 motif domain-containing protein n=1 Tax=Gloeophyllum trabeum (strain ATCC 11539 / FP-39264 / Madison 617) TaxID=670483 RepID=S7QPR9_GLOTA|nr:uncharacterized protein GLOTRDRAFT_124234 [Gloeophyllum trabeum ATCC 11539]EPQ61392.1 hypothetical protein GLOTRDRAFT_124234 [Gloeophyllum trabeum ATCC 11539]